jgi:hypothetical protein
MTSSQSTENSQFSIKDGSNRLDGVAFLEFLEEWKFGQCNTSLILIFPQGCIEEYLRLVEAHITSRGEMWPTKEDLVRCT